MATDGDHLLRAPHARRAGVRGACIPENLEPDGSGPPAKKPKRSTERGEARAKIGKDAFDYSADAIRSGQLRAHQTLDPQGLGIRESRDSSGQR